MKWGLKTLVARLGGMPRGYYFQPKKDLFYSPDGNQKNEVEIF
jgi:hypothetical protein